MVNYSTLKNTEVPSSIDSSSTNCDSISDRIDEKNENSTSNEEVYLNSTSDKLSDSKTSTNIDQGSSSTKTLSSTSLEFKNKTYSTSETPPLTSSTDRLYKKPNTQSITPINSPESLKEKVNFPPENNIAKLKEKLQFHQKVNYFSIMMQYYFLYLS